MKTTFSRIVANWKTYAAIVAIAAGLHTLQVITEQHGETLTDLEDLIEEQKTYLADLQERIEATRAAHAPAWPAPPPVEPPAPLAEPAEPNND